AALESSWLEHCLERLHDKRLVTLDVGLLGVGITTQREFEARFQLIIEELRTSQGCIVFIDELHMLVSAGAAAGRRDVAPLLVPALARGEIQCIGATTLEEYRTYIERDLALQRRFQEVIVHEIVTTDEIIVNQRRDNDSAQGTGRRVPSPDG
ncbi:MAG TPA: AAA family ATPase, partial [Ktedonobacterales bacterium]